MSRFSVRRFCLQRMRALCYLWSRRRKSLSRWRCSLSMFEGIVTSLAIFGLIYQVTFCGFRMGALLHLNDFFLVALCLAVIIRPWLIALSIGGVATRRRVIKRAFMVLQGFLCRRVATSGKTEGQLTGCGSSHDVRPLLLRTMPAFFGEASRQDFDHKHSVLDIACGSRRLTSCTVEPVTQRAHTYLALRGQDEVASAYYSSEDVRFLSSLDPPHSAAIKLETQENAMRPDSRRTIEKKWSLRLREKAGCCFGLCFLVLPVLFFLMLPWLIVVAQQVLVSGELSAVRYLRLLPYAFLGWWLVLVPCAITAVLLIGLFRHFCLLFGPEKILRAADDACAFAPVGLAVEEPLQMRGGNSPRHPKREKCRFICLPKSRQNVLRRVRSCELCWAPETLDVLALREMECSAGVYELNCSQLDRQRLELVRLSSPPPVSRTDSMTAAACSHHRRRHVLFLQRISASIPVPHQFALLNADAVRHALAKRSCNKALFRFSKTLTIGKQQTSQL